MQKEMKKVTIYLTEEEYSEMAELAADEEVSLSAVVRAKLGLSYRRRGAPEGNSNGRKENGVALRGEKQ